MLQVNCRSGETRKTTGIVGDETTNVGFMRTSSHDATKGVRRTETICLHAITCAIVGDPCHYPPAVCVY